MFWKKLIPGLSEFFPFQLAHAQAIYHVEAFYGPIDLIFFYHKFWNKHLLIRSYLQILFFGIRDNQYNQEKH